MNRIQYATLPVLLATVSCAAAPAADLQPPAELKRKIPELPECKQMIVVTTAGWDAVPAQLSCFERTASKDSWKQAWPACDAVVGRSGLAWGIGLHGSKQGGAILPEMMRWMWRDHPNSTDVRDMVERSFNAPLKSPETAPATEAPK